jgi:hypothetical protein
MTTQETQIDDAWRIAQRVAVTESYRVTIQCKYLPVTNHRGARISVSRWDSATQGMDPQRLIIPRDYSMGLSENYAEAVRRYCVAAEWLGHWRIGSTPTGAVAVWVGHVDEVEVSA